MDPIYLATFAVAFVSSALSGLAGGGGGFIMAPYWLISGMTPAQGASTGAFMATGMSASSVAAFRNTEHFPKNRKLLYILLATALVGSILGALIVPKINIHTFKYTLGVITIAALPLLFIKPNAKRRLSKHGNLGLLLAILLLIIGSIITSSAFSILFALTIVAFFDMSILQMTALRRVIGVMQSVILFVAFAVQGYFIWQHAVAGFIGGSIGSYLGTKYSVKKGETFAKYALIVMSLIGAVALII